MEDERPEILIVDDDEGHTELVLRNLRRAGVGNDVRCMTSGQEALDYVLCRGAHRIRERGGPYLILLDMKMPGRIDGVDVLRSIKSDPDKKRIPVIMLTTTDDPREVQRCFELGCNAYVTKPVDPRRFVEAIQRLGSFISVCYAPGGSSSREQ